MTVEGSKKRRLAGWLAVAASLLQLYARRSVTRYLHNHQWWQLLHQQHAGAGPVAGEGKREGKLASWLLWLGVACL